MARRLSPGWSAALAAMLVGALLVVAAASAEGTAGIGGVLRFREDGPGVTRAGIAILAGFIASFGMLLGSWVDGGASRTLLVTNAVLARVVLAAAVVFMFAFPDLSQFEAKSLAWRAILYPTLALAVPLTWWLAGRRPYPLLFDVNVVFALTVDIVSNDLHWYGTWADWDDLVHLVNSVPIMVVVAAPVLVAERRGRLVRSVAGALAFAFLVYLALHTAWEVEEHLADRFLGTNLQPGGMEEATENNLAGVAGSLLGVGVLWTWRRRARLEANLVAPLDAFLCAR